jgi:pyruvate formate-lyase activating enzyme-like uncharacterized protein
MPVDTKTFNSEGGFGVKQTTIISDNYDLQNINSLELKNTNYTDVKKSEFILKALNTAILSKSSTENSYIQLENNTVNFITANVIAVGQTGVGIYSTKLETTVKCASNGDVSTLSSLTTIIRDDVPLNQSWSVENYDTGNANEFSFNVEANGATGVVKWISHVQIVSVSW